MQAWLVTVNYPPIRGGVSRYNEGLVSCSAGAIGVVGVNRGAPAPGGDGLFARLRQVFWAWKVSKILPRSCSILVGQPHLGLGFWLAGRRFVQFIHGGEWQSVPLGNFFLGFVLRKSSLIVASSEATRTRWVPLRFHTKSLVIRPGVSSLTPILPREASVNKRFSTQESIFRIVSVGRHSIRKGFERLIEAVKKLEAEGASIELRIVGSGAMERELRALAGESESISFETNLSDNDLREAYDNAQLFALVPKEVQGGEAWEGFGIVYLEAAARGLPIVATRTGGVMEAICADGSEVLEENCSPDSIATAIRSLMSSPNRLHEMSLANLQWAASNSWASREPLVRRLLDIEDAGSLQWRAN